MSSEVPSRRAAPGDPGVPWKSRAGAARHVVHGDHSGGDESRRRRGRDVDLPRKLVSSQVSFNENLPARPPRKRLLVRRVPKYIPSLSKIAQPGLVRLAPVRDARAQVRVERLDVLEPRIRGVPAEATTRRRNDARSPTLLKSAQNGRRAAERFRAPGPRSRGAGRPVSRPARAPSRLNLIACVLTYVATSQTRRARCFRSADGTGRRRTARPTVSRPASPDGPRTTRRPSTSRPAARRPSPPRVSRRRIARERRSRSSLGRPRPRAGRRARCRRPARAGAGVGRSGEISGASNWRGRVRSFGRDEARSQGKK